MGEALSVRGHRGHVLELRVGMHHKAVVDVQHVLAEYVGRAFEREVVERGRDRAFERVLFGNDAELGFAAVHAIEHLVERGALEQLGFVDAEPLRKRSRRFVGIGTGGAEVCDDGVG